jgi:hypothetical protein
MRNLLNQLWSDDLAFIVSSELVLVATIMVIGMLVGLTSVRDQIVHEVKDVAAGLSKSVQSYSFAGITGHTATTPGSEFNDVGDFCDQGEISACDPDLCISVVAAVVEE